jgi:hypothetical protein
VPFRRALLATGVVLLVAAGCSGDDDHAASSSTSATTTSVTFTGDPQSPFCGVLREVELQGVLDGAAASAADVEAAFAAVLEALGRVVEHSPPELAEATALVLSGMAALDGALRAVGYSYDALAAEPELAVEVSQAANDPAFAVASARIEAYKQQVCGL